MTSYQRSLPMIATATVLAIAAATLLVACTTVGDDDPVVDDPAPTASPVDQGGSAADLDYPFLFEPSQLDDWAQSRDQLGAATTAWHAECAVTSGESLGAVCADALFELLREVNGVEQHWFAFDNSQWESGEFSGLVALLPVRAATLAAADSGSAWSGACGALSSGADCATKATAFLGDVDALNAAFAGWPR